MPIMKMRTAVIHNLQILWVTHLDLLSTNSTVSNQIITKMQMHREKGVRYFLSYPMIGDPCWRHRLWNSIHLIKLIKGHTRTNTVIDLLSKWEDRINCYLIKPGTILWKSYLTIEEVNNWTRCSQKEGASTQTIMDDWSS